MITKKIDNKELHIEDNFFNWSFHNWLYSYVAQLNNYAIGFGDTDVFDRAAHQYMTADFAVQHLEETNLFKHIYKTKIGESLKDKQLSKATINTTTPGQANFPHAHHNMMVLLYYINLDWKPEWAGETVFYNNSIDDIGFMSIYKPNRGILFDGDLPHSIRCQSNIGPTYRFSLSMFFIK